MKDKLLASIDIGTNTFRLLIAEVIFDSTTNYYSINEIHSERVITRLGDGLSDNGMLREKSMLDSIETLLNFSNLISKHNVCRTSAIATSALRKAGNSQDFLKQAKEVAGLDISIISGEQEAKITASGMLLDIQIQGPALLLDIGGGSTELILRGAETPEVIQSLNLGVVYMADKYMKNDPPSENMLSSMGYEITMQISMLQGIFENLRPLETSFIGTAGTVTALAAISLGLPDFEYDRIHKYKLCIDNVKKIYSRISVISSFERARLIPFDPARLDIIVPGTLILLKLMESFGFNEITVSNYGLREGILIELYNSLLQS